MASLILSFLVVFSSAAHAQVITHREVANARSFSSEKLNLWKEAYINRSNNILRGMNTNVVDFLEWSSTRSADQVFNRINRLYASRRVGPVDHQSYFQFFITRDIRKYGMSQFVLETALACSLFRHGSDFRDDACAAFPKLAVAVTRLAVARTPGRGNTYRTQGLHSSSVNSTRGLVLVRSLLPIFIARTINVPEINGSNWNNSLKRAFRSYFLLAENDINGSLQDFYTHKILEYRVAPQTEQQAQARLLANYSTSTVMSYCFARAAEKIESDARVSRVSKCASNHVMAAFLGRLMMRVISGANLDNSYEEWARVLNAGILESSGNYVPSDIYRKFESKGITYSLLQLRLSVTAAEILKNRANLDLYGVHNSKLLRAVDFVSRITTEQSASRFFTSYYPAVEFAKYVAEPVFAKRMAWARNYGFFMPVLKRYCNSSSYVTLSLSCEDQGLSGNDYNVYPRNPTTIGRYWQMKESAYMGPTQLLFSH